MDDRMSYFRSLLAEYGVTLPEKPTLEEVCDGLAAALGEAQNERAELLEDLQPECCICKYDERDAAENPCCRCEGGSEFCWRGLPDSEEDEESGHDCYYCEHFEQDMDRPPCCHCRDGSCFVRRDEESEDSGDD